MSLPRVTILIPNYNDEEYLDRSIESALNQDYPGPTVICVVDDGSTDASWDVIKDRMDNPKKDVYLGKDVLTVRGVGTFGNKEFIAIKNENSGPSGARNVGIGYTLDNTDIYAMLDSDDEMYPHKVRSCVMAMLDPMMGVAYGDYDVLHVESGKKIREFKEPYSRKRIMQECIVHSGAAVKKEALESVLEETGYYDETMRTCEDYDLWMRISEKYMIAHIPESLTLVRVTGDNSSFIVNQETWQKNWLRVMQKTDSRLDGQ